MDWRDYLDFDLEDIVRIGGDSVADAIQEVVESTIEPLIDQLEYAQSDAERELAQAELDSFRVGIDEAETITEEIQLDYLTGYMSQSYKYDQDLIDRYIEITGRTEPRRLPEPPQFVNPFEELRKEIERLTTGDPTIDDVNESLNQLIEELRELEGGL